MYKIKVNNKVFEINVNPENPQKGTLNGQSFHISIIPIKQKIYQVIYNDKKYFIWIKNYDSSTRHITLQINHQIITLQISDKVDEMLKNLGIDYSESLKVKEVKAPMPGLVLNVFLLLYANTYGLLLRLRQGNLHCHDLFYYQFCHNDRH
ncbi:MAG TPA: hypothetical protein EYP69_00080 [Bacteroidales bacterium]|nr:hypothetical protein [Bacteroidales bacterium]